MKRVQGPDRKSKRRGGRPVSDLMAVLEYWVPSYSSGRTRTTSNRWQSSSRSCLNITFWGLFQETSAGCHCGFLRGVPTTPIHLFKRNKTTRHTSMTSSSSDSWRSSRSVSGNYRREMPVGSWGWQSGITWGSFRWLTNPLPLSRVFPLRLCRAIFEGATDLRKLCCCFAVSIYAGYALSSQSIFWIPWRMTPALFKADRRDPWLMSGINLFSFVGCLHSGSRVSSKRIHVSTRIAKDHVKWWNLCICNRI